MVLPQLTAPLTVTDGGLETTLVFHARDRPARLRRLPAARHRGGPRRAGRLLRAVPRPRPSGSASARDRRHADVAGEPRLGRAPRLRRRSGSPRSTVARSSSSAALAASGTGARRRSSTASSALGATATWSATTMSAAEAAAYHGLQARAFAEAGAEMISAITMTYADEAIGVARAAGAVGLPASSRSPSRPTGACRRARRSATRSPQVDDATDAAPAYYMVNCAHPTHFAEQLDAGADWLARVQGDAGQRLALQPRRARRGHRARPRRHRRARRAVRDCARSLLDLRVVGGCCGTDHEHVAAIAESLVAVLLNAYRSTRRTARPLPGVYRVMPPAT